MVFTAWILLTELSLIDVSPVSLNSSWFVRQQGYLPWQRGCWEHQERKVTSVLLVSGLAHSSPNRIIALFCVLFSSIGERLNPSRNAKLMLIGHGTLDRKTATMIWKSTARQLSTATVRMAPQPSPTYFQLFHGWSGFPNQIGM